MRHAQTAVKKKQKTLAMSCCLALACCAFVCVRAVVMIHAQVFSVVHDLYVSYLRNPFAPLAKPVDSAKFRLAVDRQINDYNS